MFDGVGGQGPSRLAYCGVNLESTRQQLLDRVPPEEAVCAGD
jgi:hypothetical protein